MTSRSAEYIELLRENTGLKGEVAYLQDLCDTSSGGYDMHKLTKARNAALEARVEELEENLDTYRDHNTGWSRSWGKAIEERDAARTDLAEALAALETLLTNTANRSADEPLDGAILVAEEDIDVARAFLAKHLAPSPEGGSDE